MGGGQANKAQATAADAGASRSAANAGTLSNTALATGQTLQPQADTMGAERQQLHNSLWGNPAGGAPASGALGGFLDPSKLNVSAPAGPYAQMYTRANEQLAKDTQDAVGSVRRNAANRGFPQGSGAEADAELKARLGAADIRGQNFGTATNASYQDALSNFWNSVQAAQADKGSSQQGQLTTEGLQQNSTGQAITANQGGAQTYSQLYGTAGAYHPSAAAGIAQSAIGAAGAVGGGLAGNPCVCEGTLIWMDDESYKPIEDVKAGDQVRSRDGHGDQVLGVDVTPDVPCYLLATNRRDVLRASATHTLERPGGGYILVGQCMGAPISTRQGVQYVTELSGIGKRTVYRLRLKFAHIYLSANLWSLE